MGHRKWPLETGQENEAPLERLCRILYDMQPTDKPTIGQMGGLRRLYFEAFALSAAELKRSIEAPANDTPRKSLRRLIRSQAP